MKKLVCSKCGREVKAGYLVGPKFICARCNSEYIRRRRKIRLVKRAG